MTLQPPPLYPFFRYGRLGWGMLNDTWGVSDVSGIIGSTLGGKNLDPSDPTSGYAFFGNTAWFLQVRDAMDMDVH